MLLPRLSSFVLLLGYISLNVAEKVPVKNTNTKKENAKKKSYASHVMSSGNVYPMHGSPEDFTPEFTFHYKTHDIPNENELSDMITAGPLPLLSKRPNQRGVSLLNIANEAASKAMNGKVMDNDKADELGLNSPNYMSKIGLKNVSITTGVNNGGGTYKKSLKKTIKSFNNLKPVKHENNTKRFDLPYGMPSSDLSPDVAAAQGDTGFAINGNEQESAGVENQMLPDSSNFNMNENNVDKMMKKVDSFTQSSSTDPTDNVLHNLSSFNAAEMPGDSKIVKNLPSEVRNELQPEEQALAGDDNNKRQNVDQLEANEGLKSELSNIAEKESSLSSETIRQQVNIDALAQNNLNNHGVPKNEQEAELQGTTH